MAAARPFPEARQPARLAPPAALDAALREWTICVVALDAGAPLPLGLRADLALAHTVARELIERHRLGETTWVQALRLWGEPALVELLTLVGYFVMVCRLMNVARTPGPAA